MRRIVLSIVLLCSLAARAEVLLVEDFNYPIGTALSACGNWYLQWAGGDDRLSITNGLELKGYAQSGIGNGVLIDSKSSSAIPHIQLPRTITSGDVYVAMMIQLALPVGKGGWIVSLRDNVVDNAHYNENGRVLVNANNQLGISVAAPSESASGYAVMELDGQRVYLLVLKYAIKAGTNNDETSLYVLGNVCDAEPILPDVGPLCDSSVADICPANLLLRGFDNDGWIIVDGIRVATTWEEALGVEPTGIKEPKVTTRTAMKCLKDSQLVIEQGNRKWSVLGTRID